ncbi:MAG: phosphatase PAP2 family protein [Chromatiales bacterium]|nr:phosphatase PAP2 family protein [Chromatiales bacterium]
MTRRGMALRNGVLVLAIQFLLADALADDARYVAPSAVDLRELLSPPPAEGSARAQQDLDAVLRAQEARTPETVKAAQDDAVVSVFRFSDVLGPAFNGDRLPKTMALFKSVGQDSTRIGLRAKQYWQRPRPYRASERVKPVLDVSTDGSYPSGHAMYGCLTAVLLGVMVPEQRPALLERGQAYAQRRVVGGVHYPTDIEAGCTAGKIVAAVALQSPAFQSDLAAARDETRRALGLPP